MFDCKRNKIRTFFITSHRNKIGSRQLFMLLLFYYPMDAQFSIPLQIIHLFKFLDLLQEKMYPT